MSEPSWRWRFPSPRRPRVVTSRWSSDGSDPEDGRRTARKNQPRNATLSQPSPPFLTMALLKLEKILPEFGTHLAHASFENITQACAVLDTSVATATRGTSPGSVSPKSPKSPTNLPFLQWLPDRSPGGGLGASPPSALALESEWDDLQHGFLVLATAEYLYQDIMQQLKRPQSLRGLYEYVLTQLMRLHATLCEPFLTVVAATQTAQATTADAPPTPRQRHTHAARSVGKTLQNFVMLCQVRLQLIDLQSNLFTVGDLDTVLDSLRTLLAVTESSLASVGSDETAADSTTSTTTTGAGISADPVMKALVQELHLWKYTVHACWALERCEFFDTLMNLRRCQRRLPVPVQTRLEKWFDETCRILVSLLPIYFDRVAAFAKHHYGFEAVVTTNNPAGISFRDWDTKVTEFLRKQEKGPPTAVAVVLDALGANNLFLERGYQMHKTERKDEDVANLSERTLWPAVYMRSTMHLDDVAPSYRSTHSTSPNTSVLRKRGSSSKYSTEWPQSGSEQSYTSLFGSTSARNLDADIKAAKPKNRVLEYGPDSGEATSWPHNDWTALVSLMELNPVADDTDASEIPVASDGAKDSFRMAEELFAVTYRDTAAGHEPVPESSWKPSIERAVRLFGVYANSEINVVDEQVVREPSKQRSVFHIVSLSQFLSLVVMVKEDDDGHFLRRRSPLTDKEIREFMNSMAAYWNVTRRFSQDNLPKISHTSRIELIHEQWDSAKIQDFIPKIKSAFGLRATSFPLSEGHRGISFLGRNSPKRAIRRVRQEPRVDPAESASTFFLGEELARVFDV